MATNEAELKPCPFCGHANSMTVPNNATGLARTYATYCTGCRASGPPCGSESYAEEQWNTRVSSTQGDAISARAAAEEIFGMDDNVSVDEWVNNVEQIILKHWRWSSLSMAAGRKT